MFNMFNLALLDLCHGNGSLLAVVGRNHRLTGVFSLLLVLLVGIFILASRGYAFAIGWIGWYTPLILILYLVFVRILFLAERRQPSFPEAELIYGDVAKGKAYLYFAISALFIIGAGIWLAFVGDEIARVHGWGQSFVGTLFLALTTTLPEITVSFAAMRLGANDLAVANMIGSNLFNMTIIAVDDLLYSSGPILASVSEAHLATVLTVILMTLMFIAALSLKPARLFRLSWWSLATILLFIIGIYLSSPWASG